MTIAKAFPFVSVIGSFTQAKSPKASFSPDDSVAVDVTHRMPECTLPSMGTSFSGPIRVTAASTKLGFQITLKSRQGPCGSKPLIGSSPLNATGESRSAARKLRSGQTSCIPSPSITVRFRRMPGNAENGPSDATSAIDNRQTTLPSASFRRSSRVTPPPFFHGVAIRSVKRKIFMSGAPLSPLDLQRAANTGNSAL